MKATRIGITALTVATLTLLGTTGAWADGIVAGGQFASAVEHGQPVGDTASLAQGTVVYYFIRLNNPHSDELTYTVIWSVNGVARNPMRIRSRSRTNWVFQPIRASTRQLSIVIRDASGAQIHTDQVTLRP